MRFHIKHVIVVFILISFILWASHVYIDNLQRNRQLERSQSIENKVNEWLDHREHKDHHFRFDKLGPDLKYKTDINDADNTDKLLSVPRLWQYCNPPGKSVTGDEGEVSPEYRLEMVHVLIRHGDRTPMHTMKGLPTVKINCNLDKLSLTNSKLQNFASKIKDSLQRHKESDFKNWDLYPDEEYCTGSQLTGTGIHQHILNGEHLGLKFFRKWELLSSNFSSDDILVKSTEYSRTFQSAIAFMYGFLPQFSLNKLIIKKSSNLYFCSKSSGFVCFCPQANLAKQMADNFNSKLSHNSSKHQNLIKQLADIYNTKPSHIPWLSAIADIIMANVCHELKLPCNDAGQCADQNLLINIWKVIDNESLISKTKNHVFIKFSHLIMHPFLVQIAHQMKSVVLANKSVPKFVLYSGHDVTMTPLLVALGISDGLWPSYASRLVIEFYSRVVTQKKIHYFIRILYNGLDMTRQLPFCRTVINGLCKFIHFIHFIDTHLKPYNVTSYNRYCYSETN